MTEEYEIAVSNTLSGETLRYIVPKKEDVRGPAKLSGTAIALQKPVNSKVFSLSGKRESVTLAFTAIEIYDPDDPDADRSNGTLQNLVSTVTGDRETILKNRFGQDGDGDYIVRTVEEQKIWVRDYILNPSLDAQWRLFGGSYDYRTVDGNGNNTGTPVFLEEADVERDPQNPAQGNGVLGLKVGGRL